MNLPVTDMPSFIKKEVDKLNETISPFIKKVSKYSFWAFPLIVFSLINLFFLLVVMPETRTTVSLILYAVMGAFGFALSKEAKHQRKEILKVSEDYIIKRINKSDVIASAVKDRYIRRVKEQPAFAMNHFIKFLEEENRLME
ncbi:YwnF family protein [Ornithinibacillus sp. BX22]|uniref:YwnF family protein n=2 Tax=Ornithinibacillus TaxID=484508 RepID=A0A923L2P8_9BACI|nr:MULTISPECIES: YwnF family protein [Ornithinibacillus]MBC5635387.1 YwnF family protein [Ornithinibacillus hominis]MBS3678996.1 YwnF family protein [Ornithinibacillus massiliensis]